MSAGDERLDGPEQLRLAPADAELEPEAAAIGGATPEQRAAVVDRERDVFLEAGAGTGKTKVLVDRYCEAVATDEISPDKILAFTFTERAAGEMRRRVRHELGRRAAEAELAGEIERARELSRYSRAGEGAWVTTIHGFCRRLLASHPAAAGLDPRFRVLDAAESARLAAESFDEALDDLARSHEAVPQLAAGYVGPRLRNLVFAAHGEYHSRGFEAATLPEISIVAAPLDEGHDELTAAAAREGVDALRLLIGEFGGRYADAKARRSGLDFEDLQLRALRLLTEQDQIRTVYRERFRHILVDEFQDTNPVQVALIQALRGPETSLFTVGDEFQSIYSFRHADLEVFRAERDRARAGATEGKSSVLALRGSFRSSPDVVAAVNAVGHALLEDFVPLTVGAADPPVQIGEDPAVEILVTEREGWEERHLGPLRTESPPNQFAEARFLANRLRVLAENGEPRGGMALLLRAFTHVAAFEDELGRAGLNPLVVGGGGYWSHQQVDDTLHLLATVANPLDDQSLLGALASPACGASADALMILRHIAGNRRHLWPALERAFGGAGELTEEQAEWAGRMPAADAARLTLFWERVLRLRDAAPLLALDELVNRALSEFEYDLKTLRRDGGPRRLANAQKLARLAAEYEAHEGRNLRGFLDSAAARAAASEREPEAPTEAEGHDGVRIMTVHAAKGLEFDVVAVATLGRQMIAGGARADVRLAFGASSSLGTPAAPTRVGVRFSRPGQPAIGLGELDELNEAAAAAEAAEGARLTYVAASRARRRLLLSGLLSRKEWEPREEYPHGASALARLVPELGVTPTEGEVTVPAPEPRPGLEHTYPPAHIAVRVNGPERETVGPEVERLKAERRPAPAPSGAPPLLPAVDPDPAAERHLSYAALADFQRCGYRYYVERVLRLSPGAGQATGSSDEMPAHAREADEELTPEEGRAQPGARELRLGFGNAVHALLERSARTRWSRPSADAVRAALRREGLDGEGDELERAEHMIGAWLDSELLAGLTAARGRPRPEVPFLLPIGAETIVRGTIDLLIERPSQPPLFVDYKTDRLNGSDPAELAAERYEGQRGLYGLAIANAIGSDQVEAAYVFLERPEEPLRFQLGQGELDSAAQRLSADIARVREGTFEVTTDPHAALCFDCPARERLCSYGIERTLGPPAVAATRSGETRE